MAASMDGPSKATTLADPGAFATRANDTSTHEPSIKQTLEGKAKTYPEATRGGQTDQINGNNQGADTDKANGSAKGPKPDTSHSFAAKAKSAIRFARQAELLSLSPQDGHSEETARTTAVRARFITPRDPVIETASGERLPAVPLVEAERLNQLKKQVAEVALEEEPENEGKTWTQQHRRSQVSAGSQEQRALERTNEALAHDLERKDCKEQADCEKEDQELSEGIEYDAGGPHHASSGFGRTGVPLKAAQPPSHTNPLFPPLPLYGPPSLYRKLQCLFLRCTSFWLSLGFLAAIVLGAVFTNIGPLLRRTAYRPVLRDPDVHRPFYEEEKKRAAARRKSEVEWRRKRRRRANFDKVDEKDREENGSGGEEFVPTEGGKDPLRCDVAYYARRVGLDMEEFKVQTEDGFIISLWHVYNPREYTPATEEERRKGSPEVFPDSADYDPDSAPCSKRRKKNAPNRYPVLLMHGLLQSAGAYCSNDDDSLAFYLAKSGYDVWLGNNRCGFHPEHTLLTYSDPRLWCFNIRQMGVMDLPALISRVLTETGFPKLGLVCHSQGTTETFVALAKEQRPDLGKRISVFCALAPAVYAGPLIGKMYFKFMKIISPSMFRVFFGIHAFIPFMMTMHKYLPGHLYGLMGYLVFGFLFNWTDTRWDRGLRDRMFRFAPVYVSAESMRWWLGRECFAKHKCILQTREEARLEDVEDAADVAEKNDGEPEYSRLRHDLRKDVKHTADTAAEDEAGNDSDEEDFEIPEHRGRRAWYDENAPPMALWVAGNDKLVDGRRLLRRFERGREPHVKVVHSKLIEEYEHLDVLWAVDVIEQVGQEIKTVIWQTAERAEDVAVPKGCTNVKK